MPHCLGAVPWHMGQQQWEGTCTECMHPIPLSLPHNGMRQEYIVLLYHSTARHTGTHTHPQRYRRWKSTEKGLKYSLLFQLTSLLYLATHAQCMHAKYTCTTHACAHTRAHTLQNIHTMFHVPLGMFPNVWDSDSGRGRTFLSSSIARHTCTQMDTVQE